MKRTINIFAIFLAMIISLPIALGAIGGCDSGSSCCEETTIPSEQDSHDGCMSLCSCCGTSVFFNNKKEKKKTVAEIPSSIDVFFYATPLSINISTSIWHPPKSA